jgi:hypothetical protein
MKAKLFALLTIFKFAKDDFIPHAPLSSSLCGVLGSLSKLKSSGHTAALLKLSIRGLSANLCLIFLKTVQWSKIIYIIRACLSILRILFGIVFEFAVRRAIIKSESIFAVLLMIATIAICQFALAQGDNGSDPFKENYTLLAARPGFERMLAPEVIEIFDTIPNRSTSVFMNQGARLRFWPSDPKPLY